MKRTLYFLTGMLVGAVLFGGGVAYAAGVIAERSMNTIYIDGQQVELEAYSINGSNYLKLRDVGQAVGFNVYWDGAVQIDTASPYTGEAPTKPTAATGEISVSCYKGSTLTTGDGGGLIISPSGIAYTVTSSNPAVADVKQVIGYWTVTAKSPGTAEITATAPDGRTGRMTVTVTAAQQGGTDQQKGIDLSTNMEIRQELIRLINQTRRDNGIVELPVSDALMNAAQICSDRLYTWHHTQEECEAVASSGYPNGFGTNLTVFTGTTDIAQHALTNWINSPGHFQTMIDPDCDSIGVGITENGGVTYCYMFVGKPNSINPYG